MPLTPEDIKRDQAAGESTAGRPRAAAAPAKAGEQCVAGMLEPRGNTAHLRCPSYANVPVAPGCRQSFEPRIDCAAFLCSDDYLCVCAGDSEAQAPATPAATEPAVVETAPAPDAPGEFTITAAQSSQMFRIWHAWIKHTLDQT